MDRFIDIINNPWVSGIVGGVISGLIVYFITILIFEKKENKEYVQKVTTANNELLYTMRPLVAQKQIPSVEIVNSIIESTARKYSVSKDSLYSIQILADDLVREIMENSFLTADQKLSFCESIESLKQKKVDEVVKKAFDNEIYKNRLSSQYVSLILAASSASFAFLFAIKQDRFFIPDKFPDIASTYFSIIFIPIAAAIVFPMMKIAKKIVDTEVKKFVKEVKRITK